MGARGGGGGGGGKGREDAFLLLQPFPPESHTQATFLGYFCRHNFKT